jgi:hypothetical protein
LPLPVETRIGARKPPAVPMTAKHARRREHCEIQAGDAAALQELRVERATIAQEPADYEQRESTDREQDEAQLDRKHAVVRGIFREERRAEKQNGDTDARDPVAAFEPGHEAVDRAIERRRLVRRSLS